MGTDAQFKPRSLTLLFTDVVDCVGLQLRQGADRYRKISLRHDEIVTRSIVDCQGVVHERAGDSYLAYFENPTDAVRAAMHMQEGLREEPWESERPMVRVGVHCGLAEMSGGKLFGMSVNLAARVMGAAQGGQVLVTRPVYEEARQYLADDKPPCKGTVLWKPHGEYFLQGFDLLAEIFEVGVEGVSPFEPPSGGKVVPLLTKIEQERLAWKPRSGEPVLSEPAWILESPLGEGGFGSVWSARHQKTGERNAFKFCFDPFKLSHMRREERLLRIIRSHLPDRPDIVRVINLDLQRPPYYLQTEYTALGDLARWAKDRGGVSSIPLAARIDMARRVAEALSAAHGVGVWHGDLKPRNVLIFPDGDGSPRPRLADFGVGALVPGTGEPGVTMSSTMVDQAFEGFAGTPPYIPPEAREGAGPSAAGDIYALGVMLFQLVVGDLEAGIAAGWERRVEDEILRELVAECVDVEPGRRPQSAAEVSERLSNLERDRAARAAEAKRRLDAVQRKRRVRLLAVGASTLAVVAGLLAWSNLRESRLRREAEQARTNTDAAFDFLAKVFRESGPAAGGGSKSPAEVLKSAAKEAGKPDRPAEVRLKLHQLFGPFLAAFNEYEDARVQYKLGMQLAEKLGETGIADQLRARFDGLQAATGNPARDTAAPVKVAGSDLFHSAGDYAAAEFILLQERQIADLLRGPGAKAMPIAPDQMAVQFLARLMCDDNRPPEAEALLNWSDRQPDTDLTHRAWWHLNEAYRCSLVREFKEAQKDYRTALDLFRFGMGPGQSAPQVTMVRADVDLLCRSINPDRERPANEDLWPVDDEALLQSRGGLAFVSVISLRNEGRRLWRSGNLAQARADLERSERLAQLLAERGMPEAPLWPHAPLWGAHTLRVWAELALDCGELKEAGELLDRAETSRARAHLEGAESDVADQARVPILLARAHLALKQGLADVAERHLQAAAEVRQGYKRFAEHWPNAVILVELEALRKNLGKPDPNAAQKALEVVRNELPEGNARRESAEKLWRSTFDAR